MAREPRKAAAQVSETKVTESEPDPVIAEDIEVELAPEEEAEPIAVEPKESVKPAVAEPPAQPAPDEALRKRLQEMENAERLARQEAAGARQQLDEANKNLRAEQQQRWQSQKQAWDDRYSSVVNAMGGAQSMLDAAKVDLKAAGAEGDWERIAEAQERIGRASADLREFERQKDWMESENEKWRQQQQQPRQQQPRQQAQPQQQQPPTVEQVIASYQLPDSAKDWLRKHPEYVTDPVKNAQAQKMHYVAEYQAGEAFTGPYYEILDGLLGLKQPQANGGNGAQQPAPQRVQRQAAPVSAPPTREAPSMTTGQAQRSTKVTLTKEQQEIAWISRPRDNMTRAEANAEYAKNLLKAQGMKERGEMS